MKFTEEDKLIVATNKDLPSGKRTIVPSIDSLTTTLNLMASGSAGRENAMPNVSADGKVNNFTAAAYLASYLAPAKN